MTNKEKTNSAQKTTGGIPEETGKLVRLTDEEAGQVTGGIKEELLNANPFKDVPRVDPKEIAKKVRESV